MTDPFTIHEDDITARINRRQHDDWTEATYLVPGGEAVGSPPLAGKFLGVGVAARHLFWLAIISCLVLAGLLGRSVYLQAAQGAYYRGLAEGNRLRLIPLPADRGVFFDHAGLQLSKNIPSYQLQITPADLPASAATQTAELANLAELLPISIEEITALLERGGSYPYQPITIQTGLTYQEIVSVTLAGGALPGVQLIEGARREYRLVDNDGSAVTSLSHVLGYVGRLNEDEYRQRQSGYSFNDVIGKNGLEQFYEETLRGRSGRKQVEVDARGQEKTILAASRPVAGQDLTLAIDFNLQAKAEGALRSVLQKTNKQRGAVIILDPRDGRVRALVSYPTFDANIFATGISSAAYQNLLTNPNRPLFNRAISGAYPSGSTIKPVLAAAALAEGVITPQTSFVSGGGIRIGQWFFPDWKAGGHGVTDVYRAIAESVNTFFYMIGGGYPIGGSPANGYEFVGLGPDRIATWLTKFGLGVTSGIDLPGEVAGFIPTVEWKNARYGEKWYIGDTYNLSIGQGSLLVTPLQVAIWTATVANGGVVYQPQVVEKIGSQPVAPIVVRSDVAPAAVLQTVRQGMRQTVLSGSARSFATLPIPVAAKTGTAQWSTDGAPHAWFASFAPYEHPEIVVVVLVEEGEEGSSVAAPVARDILYYYATRNQK
ncbi:MAG: penicillin-binding protein 2 [Patescibacteria group bacterium]